MGLALFLVAKRSSGRGTPAACNQCEEEDYKRRDDFGDEEDAGVIGGVIVAERDLADVADSVAKEPHGVGDGSGEPEVSAESETEDAKDAHGEIGHTDFVFVGACGPSDRCRGFERTEDVCIGRKESHEAYIDEEEIEQIGFRDC